MPLSKFSWGLVLEQLVLEQKQEQNECTFPANFPGNTEVTCPGPTLRTTVLKNSWHFSWSEVQTVESHKTQAMRGVKMKV